MRLLITEGERQQTERNDEGMTKRTRASPVANATNASRTHMTAAFKMLRLGRLLERQRESIPQSLI